MIMTIDKFYKIENEVIETIKGSFDIAINKSISDFVLLVARGGYQPYCLFTHSDFQPDSLVGLIHDDLAFC